MAIATGSYPRARLTRPGPIPTSLAPVPGGVVIPPTLTVLTIQIGTNAGTRSTRSSRKLYGPALLKSYNITLGGAASGQQAIELGVAASAITETNVGNNVTRGWRPLLETLNTGMPGDNADRVGFPEADFVAGAFARNDNANIVILDAEFFLTVTNWSAGGGADVFAGHVVIAEKVSPEILANFL